MTKGPKQVRRLARNEFAAALKKGQGRALQHVLAYGLDDVSDLVLDACLHDQRYDAQAEPGRGAWLFQMFGHSELYLRFQATILEHLKTETNTWDALQLLFLAAEMADHGDEQARQELGAKLRERAARVEWSDDWLGAELWVELAGESGLLELARIYGKRLLKDPKDLVPGNIFGEGGTAQEHRETLRRYAEGEPEIKIYSDYLEERDAKKEAWATIRVDEAARNREAVRRQYDVARILKVAKAHASEWPGRFYRFGRVATAPELEEIHNLLLQERDVEARLRLLWVFRRATLPLLSNTLFEWANGSDPVIRAAAIAALSNSHDVRVHELAIAKARAGELVGADSEALELFRNNYLASDAPIISQAVLLLRPSADDAHDLSFSLTDLATQYPDMGMAPALLWVYENTPCAYCRERALVQLDARQRLSADVVQECLFDSSEHIRLFAQNQPASKS